MKEIERSLGKRYLGHYADETGKILYSVTIGQVLYKDGSVGTVYRKSYMRHAHQGAVITSGPPELEPPPMTYRKD